MTQQDYKHKKRVENQPAGFDYLCQFYLFQPKDIIGAAFVLL